MKKYFSMLHNIGQLFFMEGELALSPWLSRTVHCVAPEESIGEVAQKMRDRSIGAIMVTEGDRVVGIFTERDLLMRVVGAGLNPLEEKVCDHMTKDIIVLDESDSLDDAFMLMLRRNIRHVPIVSSGRLVGLLSVRDMMRHRYNLMEQSLVESRRELAELKNLLQADGSTRLRELLEQNEKLKKLALTDELTGLYNHRYFQERLEEEIIRARRYHYPLSLIFIDVDHFKKYNDRNGHIEGDQVLKTIGRILHTFSMEIHISAKLRKSDIVARYGGEEFVVLLPYTDGKRGALVAERLRRTIEEHPFKYEEHQPGGSLTISLGLAAFPEHASSREELVRLADEALYQAKNGGKNRVCVYKKDSAVR